MGPVSDQVVVGWWVRALDASDASDAASQLVRISQTVAQLSYDVGMTALTLRDAPEDAGDRLHDARTRIESVADDLLSALARCRQASL